MRENKEYKPLGTKISKEAWQRLHVLASKKGMSIYEMIQMVCDTLLRYMDDQHNLTPEMEKAMAIFEHMEGWSQAFNLADPTMQSEIGEATYYLQDAEGKKRGVRAVHVTKPFMEAGRTETMNLQQILERTIELLMPERYRRLCALAEEKDCSGLLELLDTLIDLHAADSDTEELRQQFEDCNRHEYGKPIEYGKRTRQTKRRNIETMTSGSRQDGNTHDDAPEEVDMYERMGFQPHGGEW